MPLKKLLNKLHIRQSDFDSKFPDFVPYLYLDGHRTSGLAKEDSKCYKSGIEFFLRLAGLLRKLNCKEMVTMIYTSRNKAVKDRIKTIQDTIIKNLNLNNNSFKDTRFLIYGNTDSKIIKNNKFKRILEEAVGLSNTNYVFTHHLLVNYSEDWALRNLNQLNMLPSISAAIRFTKGYLSGGWVPFKMQENIFLYSQIPSVSEYWSDEALLTLILIAFSNWSKMSSFIGKKSYNFPEKKDIHRKRDIDLQIKKVRMKVNSPMSNRIIVFDEHGPIIYELRNNS